jgi:diguanylate cyclase
MVDRDPKYTLGVARAAIEQIAALELPADPPSFAVWYNYVSARNPRINCEINDLLKGNAKLSLSDVDRISDEHLSPTGALVRIERVEADLAQEVDRIMESIVTACAGAAQYRADLADAHSKLDGRSERIAIRSIVQSLVPSTREMEFRNLALENTLEVSRRVIEGLHKDVDNIRSESMKDALTLLANRKHFDMALGQAVADATDRNAAFSILMIDIDHFKQFNDIYGHQVGDEVLRAMGQTLKDVVKGQEMAARYGGEEFAVLLPEADLEQAKRVGENIRALIARKVVRRRSSGDLLGRITVSVGVAQFGHGDCAESLVERADRSLYVAKHQGRNIVTDERALASLY